MKNNATSFQQSVRSFFPPAVAISLLIGLLVDGPSIAQALKEGPQQKQLAPRPLPPAARSEEAQVYSVTQGTPQLVTPGFARMKEARALQATSAATPGAPAPARSRLNGQATAVRQRPAYLSDLYPTPNVVDFGSMLIGQRQSRFVTVIAPADGILTATVADPNLRLKQVLTFMGPISIIRSAARAASANGPISLTQVQAQVDSQASGTQPQINVKAGQDVVLIVDFNPLRARGLGVGPFKSSLRLQHSNGRMVDVPIQARLDGMMEGIGVDFDVPAMVVSGSDFAIRFTWYNDGEPSSATLDFGNLPTGFVAISTPQNVTLAKGQRLNGELAVHASQFLVPPGAFGHLETLTVQLVNGSTRLAYGFDVYVISPWLMQAVGARARFSDGEEVYLSGNLQIRSDGWFEFSGQIDDTSVCNGPFNSRYRYDAAITLPGGFGHAVHGSFGHGEIFQTGICNDHWDESGMNVALAYNFTQAAAGLLQAVPSLHVTRSAF